MILLNGEKKSFPRSDRMKAIKFILVFVLNFSSTFKVSHELKKKRDESVMLSGDPGSSLQQG